MALVHPPVTSAGATTSFLPLSTAWPLTAQCSSLFVSHPQNNGLFAFDPASAIHNSAPQCLPPEATAWWDQSSGTTLTELGGYSMVCPGAYTTATTTVIDSLSTLVGCCPSSYDFVTWASAPIPNQCSSVLPAQVVTYVQSDSAGSWSTTSTTIATPSSVWAVQINGYLFARITESSPGPTMTSTPTTSNEASTTFAASAATSTTADNGSTLGKATIIGMAIGLGFIAACSIAAAIMVFCRRLQRRRPVRPPSQDAIGALYPELKDQPPPMVTPENFEMSPRRMRRELYPAQFGEIGRMVA